jgi:exopolysaccharide production repressor protein
MTLPKFIVGMIFVITCVAMWSYFDRASLGVTLLRAVICAIVLQVGYFIIVLGMIFAGSPNRADVAQNRPAPAPDTTDAKGKAPTG